MSHQREVIAALHGGRWVVDAEVTLPSAAEAGAYAYEIEFTGDALRFSKSLTFVVYR